MSSEQDTNQTTVQDIENWLEVMYETKGLSFSGHKLKTLGEKIWGISIFEDKHVYVYFIIDDADPEEIYIEMRSVLGKEPKSNLLPFYRKCLELNHGFSNGSITLNEAEIWFFQYQNLEDITFENFAEMFASQLGITEELYETLTDEFDIIEMLSH
jgi:hypothetical protein